MPIRPADHARPCQAWIDDKTAPSGAFAKCRVCNGLLSLLLELNGDLPDAFPGHERRLYIWTCRRKTCRRKDGSVRALRGVRVAKGSKTAAKTASKAAKEEPNHGQPAPQPKLGESLFGVKNGTAAPSTAPANPFSNPFSSSNAASPPANPFAPASTAANPFAVPVKATLDADQPPPPPPSVPTDTFASKLRINSPSPPPSSQPSAAPPRPHEPYPPLNTFPPPFPHYSLDAEYETLDAPSTPSIPANTRLDMDTEAAGGSGKEDKEVYESTLDKTFQKFADRVGQNPEQVLRYEFKGKPLLYSDTDAIGKLLAPYAENASSSNVKVTTTTGGVKGMPRCVNCGAERVFELQLTPHAITELEAEDMTIDGMEWGTIVMGVCSRDCTPSDVVEGEVGYVEEWVGVQWEEVAKK